VLYGQQRAARLLHAQTGPQGALPGQDDGGQMGQRLADEHQAELEGFAR